jgi:hypothetical protein
MASSVNCVVSISTSLHEILNCEKVFNPNWRSCKRHHLILRFVAIDSSSLADVFTELATILAARLRFDNRRWCKHFETFNADFNTVISAGEVWQVLPLRASGIDCLAASGPFPSPKGSLR